MTESDTPRWGAIRVRGAGETGERLGRRVGGPA